MLLNSTEMAKLLNRSLTTAETDNFKLYLNIATQRLEELLCMDLTSDAGERTYQTRYSYRTVYVDPFSEINSITIDDDEVDADDYTIKQNDKLNADWYNIIEFDIARRGQKIVVDADWGFGSSCPNDLQLLLARIFACCSAEQTAETHVKSKSIEDFSVSYKDSGTFDELVLANKAIIDKYNTCSQGYIRHGRVDTIYYD